MKVLVVGSGGREHAIAEAVGRSHRNPTVVCAPGNGGTASFCENVAIAPDAIDQLAAFARDEHVDLTIVGPEAPLCAGIVDRFVAEGLRIFGPSAKAARLEGDKAYAKELLVQSGIPTARGRWFCRFDDAKAYLATRDTPQVVKATGLAAGKGVVVCDDPADALIEAEKMMVGGKFGGAGREVLIEEKLLGQELSVLALVDGRNIYVLESSQDHKRAGDGDTGPNTGGMGAFSPAPLADAGVMESVQSEIIVPIVDALRRGGVVYRGVLYCGVMLTAAGPKVLEFNCRFGDPETQVILIRLKSDLLDAIDACIDGTLDQIALRWDPRPAVCVVMASDGYPQAYKKGKVIDGLPDAQALSDVRVYHAGTRMIEDYTLTDGGRVLGVTALAESLSLARRRAYQAVGKITFEGAFYRRDIAL